MPSEPGGWLLPAEERRQRQKAGMPVPVLTVAQMRAWEQASWEAGRSEREVIERVGRLLAARVLRLTREGDRLLILAGRGHNGDDARCAQPHVAGRVVELLNITDPHTALAKVRIALGRGPALVVDGLFGIGLNRPLDTEWLAVVHHVNSSGLPVLAVDVPSGLDADTGAPLGGAVRARWTVTLGAPKAGLLKASAWEFTGRLEVEPEIGLVPCPSAGELWWTLPEDFAGFPPPRPVAGHKGSAGHLLILAGSKGYHGAAVLAARAAQRAHPGLITLGTAPEVYVPVASQLQAVMVDDWVAAQRKLPDCTGVLVGPGLAAPEASASLREMLAEVWREAPVPVVVDASAHDWLPPDSPAAHAPRVITPHPGEAARRLGIRVVEVQADRPGAVRELSRRHGGCHVVLKGYQTLVGSAEGRLDINSSGDATLGQGGTGDVLAGYLAGLLAQPSLQGDVPRTVRYAVWQHGAAADWLSGHHANWTPEDLAERLGEVLPEHR